jgi:hypothetical protein
MMGSNTSHAEIPRSRGGGIGRSVHMPVDLGYAREILRASSVVSWGLLGSLLDSTRMTCLAAVGLGLFGAVVGSRIILSHIATNALTSMGVEPMSQLETTTTPTMLRAPNLLVNSESALKLLNSNIRKLILGPHLGKPETIVHVSDPETRTILLYRSE